MNKKTITFDLEEFKEWIHYATMIGCFSGCDDDGSTVLEDGRILEKWELEYKKYLDNKDYFQIKGEIK